ncbi:MAG: hypothetical protein IK089_01365 [Oxalobacter sp.]|nr:hypothetical protein [Oxalobacter sp.]
MLIKLHTFGSAKSYLVPLGFIEEVRPNPSGGADVSLKDYDPWHVVETVEQIEALCNGTHPRCFAKLTAASGKELFVLSSMITAVYGVPEDDFTRISLSDGKTFEVKETAKEVLAIMSGQDR